MRLSEAIMLGITTVKLQAKNINSCAIGCALNAMGIPMVERPFELSGHAVRNREAIKLWPWLGSIEFGSPQFNGYGRRIWAMFDLEVCTGEASIEQLVDDVRKCEPDCDCCRFGCDCAQTPAEVTETEYVRQT